MTSNFASSVSLLPFLLLFFLVFSPNGKFLRFTEGGQRRIHITDDLGNVVDDEEDDSWKEWGKVKTPGLEYPTADLNNMELSQIQSQFLKKHVGPVIGFIKLRWGVPRSANEVAEMAMKWTKVLRTGALGVKFTGIDMSTVMFNVERGQLLDELKDFILDQPEAYEIKIGDQVFRRPGDPPLEEVIEKLRQERNKPSDDDEHEKDEL